MTTLTTTIRALGCDLTVDVDYTDEGGDTEPSVEELTVIRVNDQPVPHFAIDFTELPDRRQDELLFAIRVAEMHANVTRSREVA